MAKRGTKPRKSRSKPPAQAPAPSPAAGVLIEMKGEDMEVRPLGDTKLTELPALLGIARRVSEQKLGIGGG